MNQRKSCRRKAGEVDEFIKLTTTADIAQGGMKAVSLDDHELLVANIDQEYFIADARCPHVGGHLPDGVLDGTILTCPRHHSRFDLRDGRVIRWTDWEGMQLSIGRLLRHPRPLRTYAVKLVGDDLYVGPEKPPAAV
jgi:3-phenylpropionate/trans-cinnamate dioxygenase ferredoxin subunit